MNSKLLGLGSIASSHLNSIEYKNTNRIKRKIFYEVENWINTVNGRYLILTGPRKCGKTVCIEQIQSKFNVDRIYDFKRIRDKDESTKIVNSILNATSGIFLIDEITYLNDYEGFLYDIDKSVSENINSNINDTRRFIITGSQSYAISRASRLSLATNADYIQTSFIDFEEWLLYSGKITTYGEEYKPTDIDFKEYMCNSSKFCRILNNTDYLSSCIEETIESERNSINSVYGMIDTYDLSVDDILSVFYSFLISLHNEVKVDAFKHPINRVRVFNESKNDSRNLSLTELKEKVSGRFDHLHVKRFAKDFDKLKRAVIFLEQLDLITITENVLDIENFVPSSISSDYMFENMNYVKFFNRFNVCVKHPMFYFNILKEIYPDIYSNLSFIGNDIYGSAMECVVKSLLSYHINSSLLYCYKYETEKSQGEIDIVDFNKRILYEVTVGTKHKLKHLYSVEGNWNKVCISGVQDKVYGGLSNWYYPECILDLSKGYIVKEISKLRYT